MSRAEFEQEVSFDGEAEMYLMTWVRITKTFSVKFMPEFWSTTQDHIVIVDGMKMTRREASILRLQGQLAEIANTGDLV